MSMHLFIYNLSDSYEIECVISKYEIQIHSKSLIYSMHRNYHFILHQISIEAQNPPHLITLVFIFTFSLSRKNEKKK